MLVMTEKVATWLMNPQGRYIRWLVTQDSSVTGLDKWLLTQEQVKEGIEGGDKKALHKDAPGKWKTARERKSRSKDKCSM